MITYSLLILPTTFLYLTIKKDRKEYKEWMSNR